jgi:hypothetical protein
VSYIPLTNNKNLKIKKKLKKITKIIKNLEGWLTPPFWVNGGGWSPPFFSMEVVELSPRPIGSYPKKAK